MYQITFTGSHLTEPKHGDELIEYQYTHLHRRQVLNRMETPWRIDLTHGTSARQAFIRARPQHCVRTIAGSDRLDDPQLTPSVEILAAARRLLPSWAVPRLIVTGAQRSAPSTRPTWVPDMQAAECHRKKKGSSALILAARLRSNG
jgi:hypothetical protein